MPGITVGVDGSHHAQPALDWAAKEAGIRHAPLTVLTVHEVASNHWTGNPVVLPEDEVQRDKAQELAEAAAAKATEGLDAKPSSVTVRAVTGLAARELINASRDSDLVVVGTRGGGGFATLMLGSVSTQVVHHSACPVVVVPTGH